MEFFSVPPQDLVLKMKETFTYDMFEDIVIFFARRNIQNTLVPTFMLQSEQPGLNSVAIAMENLHRSMCCIYEYIALHSNVESLKNCINDILKTSIIWIIKDILIKNLKKLYTFSFQFFLQDHCNHLHTGDVCKPRIKLYFKEEQQEVETQMFREFHDKKFTPMVQKWLVDLDLQKICRDEIVVSIVKTEIDRYVTQACSKQYEQSWIGDEKDILGNWTRSHVIPWLNMIFHDQFDKNDWQEKVLYIVYNSYTKLRINEMLNIITEYPESLPVLNDLKICLQHTRQRPSLIKLLKEEITNRVLHPGVSTQNIITVYISAVKALRELDVSGIVMETVMETCTTYLTQREDSVRMIMQGLLWDDGANDLAVELASNEKIVNQQSSLNVHATKTVEDWLPDPREADPKKSDKSTRTSDIVTLFIAMYGSKEKFIKEYQKLLSKRLLQTWCRNRNESNEIRNLELLKMRFGEDDMSKCAVMIKDIADSRRININIKDDKRNCYTDNCDLHTMIVSSEFWPEITNQELELPSPVNKSFQCFKKDFEGMKVSRSLSWLKSVGMAELELEFDDKTIKVKVPPLQAAIIWQFQDKDLWSIEELGSQLKIPPTVLRRKMTYWIQQGIIKQVKTDYFKLIENHDGLSGCSKPHSLNESVDQITFECLDEDYDDEDNTEDSTQKEKTNQILWNYIQGMLKNLESLTLDKIHKMLQMFVAHNNDLQIELSQLREMLGMKMQKGLLLFENGKYKLVRDR